MALFGWVMEGKFDMKSPMEYIMTKDFISFIKKSYEYFNFMETESRRGIDSPSMQLQLLCILEKVNNYFKGNVFIKAEVK
jgi:hypothetical protein